LIDREQKKSFGRRSDARKHGKATKLVSVMVSALIFMSILNPVPVIATATG
jgi:hypothetical protein